MARKGGQAAEGPIGVVERQLGEPPVQRGSFVEERSHEAEGAADRDRLDEGRRLVLRFGVRELGAEQERLHDVPGCARVDGLRELPGPHRGFLERHPRGQQLRVGSRWSVADRGPGSGHVSPVEPHVHLRAAEVEIDRRWQVRVRGTG